MERMFLRLSLVSLLVLGGCATDGSQQPGSQDRETSQASSSGGTVSARSERVDAASDSANHVKDRGILLGEKQEAANKMSAVAEQVIDPSVVEKVTGEPAGSQKPAAQSAGAADGIKVASIPPNTIREKAPTLSSGKAIELTTDRGPSPVYGLGESLKLKINLKKPGMVYCFYQMAQGQIVRLFPNRFHTNAHVGGAVEVPDTKDFHIMMDNAGQEQILCLTSSSGGVLSDKVLGADLAPSPFTTLDAAKNALTKSLGGRVDVDLLTITIQ